MRSRRTYKSTQSCLTQPSSTSLLDVQLLSIHLAPLPNSPNRQLQPSTSIPSSSNRQPLRLTQRKSPWVSSGPTAHHTAPLRSPSTPPSPQPLHIPPHSHSRPPSLVFLTKTFLTHNLPVVLPKHHREHTTASKCRPTTCPRLPLVSACRSMPASHRSSTCRPSCKAGFSKCARFRGPPLWP